MQLVVFGRRTYVIMMSPCRSLSSHKSASLGLSTTAREKRFVEVGSFDSCLPSGGVSNGDTRHRSDNLLWTIEEMGLGSLLVDHRGTSDDKEPAVSEAIKGLNIGIAAGEIRVETTYLAARNNPVDAFSVRIHAVLDPVMYPSGQRTPMVNPGLTHLPLRAALVARRHTQTPSTLME